MIKNFPPNFAFWKLTETSSLFFDTQNKGMAREIPRQDDDAAPLWIADENIYVTADGLGIGKEYVFFRKHTALIFWGLKGEVLKFFSVFSDGKWKNFSVRDAQPQIAAIAAKSNPKFIIMCRVTVRNRNNQEILQIFIKRN